MPDSAQGKVEVKKHWLKDVGHTVCVLKCLLDQSGRRFYFPYGYTARLHFSASLAARLGVLIRIKVKYMIKDMIMSLLDLAKKPL